MDSVPHGAEAFRWAAIIEKFKYTPEQIAALTDWQIDHLLFHKRDKDGKLVAPELPAELKKPPTFRERLATIGLLESEGVITAENARECREEIHRKYGGASGGTAV